MTIAQNSLIEIADLNATFTSSLTLLKADAAIVPAVYWTNLNFNGITDVTSLIRRTRKFILPDDHFLCELAVTAGEHAGTITVTIDNGALIESISLSEVVTSPGYDPFTTRYYTNTTKPAQLLLRGSELTVTVSTTDTSSSSTVQVAIGLQSVWRRN